MSVLRALTTEAANKGLTEFSTEILRVDNGRRKRIRRVDVLPSDRNISTHLLHGTDGRLTTVPRANGCCDPHHEESDEWRKKCSRRETRTRWKTIGVP
jgi:hypothetical protein